MKQEEIILKIIIPEVHRESNTHDEIDKGHPIKTHTPPCHVADDTNLEKKIIKLTNSRKFIMSYGHGSSVKRDQVEVTRNKYGFVCTCLN